LTLYACGQAADPRIRDLARRVRVSGAQNRKGWAAHVVVSLRDGRRFAGELDSFHGCPESPLPDEQLRFKFDRLCKDASPALRQTLFDI
jgi:hypothetical protein